MQLQLSQFITNRPFFATGIMGFFVIVIAIWMQQFFPSESAHLPKGFSTPIIYFEFIQSPAEVIEFFGIADDGIPDESFVSHMNKGNYLDFLFMFVYSAFLSLFFYHLLKVSGKKWFIAGIALALISLTGDFFENLQLLGITANLESGDYHRHLFLLRFITLIKWGSLALIFALFSIWLFKQKNLSRFLAYLYLIPVLLFPFSFLIRGIITEIFTKSIAIVFFVTICYCFLFTYQINHSPGKAN